MRFYAMRQQQGRKGRRRHGEVKTNANVRVAYRPGRRKRRTGRDLALLVNRCRRDTGYLSRLSFFDVLAATRERDHGEQEESDRYPSIEELCLTARGKTRDRESRADFIKQ